MGDPGGETYLYGSDCGNVTVGGTTFEVGDTADIGADQASNPDYRHACDEHWVAKLDSVGEYEWHVVTEADVATSARLTTTGSARCGSMRTKTSSSSST